MGIGERRLRMAVDRMAEFMAASEANRASLTLLEKLQSVLSLLVLMVCVVLPQKLSQALGWRQRLSGPLRPLPVEGVWLCPYDDGKCNAHLIRSRIFSFWTLPTSPLPQTLSR